MLQTLQGAGGGVDITLARVLPRLPSGASRIFYRGRRPRALLRRVAETICAHAWRNQNSSGGSSHQFDRTGQFSRQLRVFVGGTLASPMAVMRFALIVPTVSGRADRNALQKRLKSQ